MIPESNAAMQADGADGARQDSLAAAASEGSNECFDEEAIMGPVQRTRTSGRTIGTTATDSRCPCSQGACG